MKPTSLPRLYNALVLAIYQLTSVHLEAIQLCVHGISPWFVLITKEKNLGNLNMHPNYICW
jgi:hypothetical protein